MNVNNNNMHNKRSQIIAHPLSAPGRQRTYTVAGNVNRHRIEELDENTEYNVTVEARSGGTFGSGRHSVMSTDDLSEFEH